MNINRCQHHDGGDQKSDYKNPPGDACPVREVIQPFLQKVDSDWDRKQLRHYDYDKIAFQVRTDNSFFRTSEYFPDPDLFGPGPGHKKRQPEQPECRDQQGKKRRNG